MEPLQLLRIADNDPVTDEEFEWLVAQSRILVSDSEDINLSEPGPERVRVTFLAITASVTRLSPQMDTEPFAEVMPYVMPARYDDLPFELVDEVIAAHPRFRADDSDDGPADSD